ncbi:type I-C CRISPR-associated protein Cas8c/Csd1 [Eubacterium aggregans]|uniref:type I-C CRISPR-associated protein Cas8c/Csd1 n=1 Tax=Eubacterium aggregans TaxID=81409 RepID=UPI003F36C496
MAAFGVEREEKNQKKLGMNDKLMKSSIQRILPCIANGMKFPEDLMLAAVRNAGHPMTMRLGNWTRVLNNACSMICLYYYTQKGEELSMGLDYECKDRSYLFGRMLAVANYAEEQTYDEDDKKRVSNARRYWNVFSGKPGRTWKIIYENLTPYFDKLDQGKRGYINKVLGEITDEMTPSMMMDERALSPLYLLGFQHQNSVLWMSKAEKEKLGKEGM